MVVLSKIYTRTGDDGSTALGSGERVKKSHLRIHAYGTVDEANASIGVARQHTRALLYAELDRRLALIQNDLFDLGADLCCPDSGANLGYEPLRIVAGQVERLEADIDELNSEIKPLRSFVLPGGHPAAAALHVARTVCRRAERHMVELAALPDQHVSPEAMRYINRLSDFLFVASRFVNALDGQGDVTWVPGKTRKASAD
jgi:cob(I)alamin adenosyltransferase